MTESERLHALVREVIRAPEPRRVEGVAREVLAFQARHVDPVARLLRARGTDPATTPLDELPGVPCDVFRLRRVAAHPPSEDVRVFRTSGTTLGLRGEHFFRDLGTYELAAVAFAKETLLQGLDPVRVLALAPPCAEVPDSSLGFMIELFAGARSIPIEHFVSLAGGVDAQGFADAAERARRHGAPVLFLGTAFAFVHLLDDPRALDLRLPAGSRAMLTGGFKGRSREVSEPELRAMLADRLAVPPSAIVGEYGMTELSSQLYERPRSPHDRVRYAWPPWMRVVAVDAESLSPVSRGEPGLCKIIDLANVDSAMIIQTNDLVRLHDDGLELLGRAPGATPRGCSLAIEEITGG